MDAATGHGAVAIGAAAEIAVSIVRDRQHGACRPQSVAVS